MGAPEVGGLPAGNHRAVAESRFASRVVAFEAVPAMAAGEGVLHNDPVAFLDSMVTGCLSPDFRYLPDHLMPHYYRVGTGLPAFFTLVNTGVGAADAHHFHFQQGVFGADIRYLERTQRHLSRRFQNHSSRF